MKSIIREFIHNGNPELEEAIISNIDDCVNENEFYSLSTEKNLFNFKKDFFKKEPNYKENYQKND